jgi:Protein of unknown function (DUF3533)
MSDEPRSTSLSSPGWALAIGGAVVALILQAIFIASYVGALHDPKPHEALAFGIVAPPQVAEALVSQISTQAAGIIDPAAMADEAALRDAIADQEVYGGLIVSQTGAKLLVADATGSAAVTTLTTFATGLATAQNMPLEVEHTHPLDTGDPRGLTLVYLVFGWVFGGYFCATVLTTLIGTGYRDRTHSMLRLALLAGYAVVSGIVGALLVGSGGFDAIDGHFLGLVLAGALLVFAVGASTIALQLLLGIAGTGLVLILFVLLGNPSSGGVVPAEFLPGFWRAIGGWLPNAAGFELARSITYFDGANLTRPILILLAYAVTGSALLVFFADRKRPELLDVGSEAELATGAAL